MGKFIVEHEKFGKVLFDTDTQQYEYYEYTGYNYFNYNGKRLPYFDDAQQFLNSEADMAVVPMICNEAKQLKRRTYIDLIDKANYTYRFFNVELIDSRWIANKIDNVFSKCFYFTIIIRDNKAINDFRLLSTLQIKKGMHNTPPLKHTKE